MDNNPYPQDPASENEFHNPPVSPPLRPSSRELMPPPPLPHQLPIQEYPHPHPTSSILVGQLREPFTFTESNMLVSSPPPRRASVPTSDPSYRSISSSSSGSILMKQLADPLTTHRGSMFFDPAVYDENNDNIDRPDFTWTRRGGSFTRSYSLGSAPSYTIPASSSHIFAGEQGQADPGSEPEDLTDDPIKLRRMVKYWKQTAKNNDLSFIRSSRALVEPSQWAANELESEIATLIRQVRSLKSIIAGYEQKEEEGEGVMMNESALSGVGDVQASSGGGSSAGGGGDFRTEVEGGQQRQLNRSSRYYTIHDDQEITISSVSTADD